MAKKENRYWTMIKKGVRFVEHDIWRMSINELSPRKSFLIRQLRIFILAIKGFAEDKIQVRASALTYFTLFGMVPFVGLAFGIAKGFGLETYLEEQLRHTFSGRDEILNWILGFAQSMLQTAKGGMLAGVGLVILLYTVMRVLAFIEESFNDIWQVKKPRSWSRKFSDYFAMMFVAPLFLIMASAATVFLNTQIAGMLQDVAVLEFLSPAIRFLGSLVPYLLIWIMFLILYMVMPNTNVRFSSALIAAIIAGTLFQFAQWGYLYFQIGVSKYSAIYGSFAALPLLMFFMHTAWLIVLFGAEIAYANQNIEQYEYEAESQLISPFNKKLLSVYVMHLLIKNFIAGDKPMTSAQISHLLQMPNKLVRSILNDLTDVFLVVETKTDLPKEVGFQPSMDPTKINVNLVLNRLDKNGLDIMIAKPSPELDSLKAILKDFDQKIETSGRNVLLQDLV